MKPKTYNFISALSLEFKDPKRVKVLIREYVDANIDHLKATNVKNMMEQHFHNNVALKDVHDSAKALTAKISPCQAQNKARLQIERSIMSSKLSDARRKESSSKKKFIRCKNDMCKVVRKGTLVYDKLMYHVKNECEALWSFEMQKSKHKFRKNKERQSLQNPTIENGIVDGVKVGDKELEELRLMINVMSGSEAPQLRKFEKILITKCAITMRKK